MLAPSSYTHYLCSKEMREMRKLIVLMVFALLSVVTVKAITLSGNVQDASANEPLPQASVRLLSQRDSSLVKGVVTDNNGRFRINGVKAGRYIVEASYVGFTPVLRNVTVADKDITLKAFELTESSIMLSEYLLPRPR